MKMKKILNEWRKFGKICESYGLSDDAKHNMPDGLSDLFRKYLGMGAYSMVDGEHKDEIRKLLIGHGVDKEFKRKSVELFESEKETRKEIEDLEEQMDSYPHDDSIRRIQREIRQLKKKLKKINNDQLHLGDVRMGNTFYISSLGFTKADEIIKDVMKLKADKFVEKLNPEQKDWMTKHLAYFFKVINGLSFKTRGGMHGGHDRGIANTVATPLRMDDFYIARMAGAKGDTREGGGFQLRQILADILGVSDPVTVVPPPMRKDLEAELDKPEPKSTSGRHQFVGGLDPNDPNWMEKLGDMWNKEREKNKK